MTNIEIYDFFRFSDICLVFVTLSTINNFIFVYCSEQNEMYSFIETLPQVATDEFYGLSPSNQNINFIPCVEERTNSNLEISAIDLPGMDKPCDTHNDTPDTMNLSNQDDLTDFLSIYSSKDLSENSFEGLLNYLEQDSPEDYEIFSYSQNEEINSANTESDKNLDTLQNKHSKHVMAGKVTKLSPISTTIAHHTEPFVESRCDMEPDQNNLISKISENKIDIPTNSRYTNYLSNLLDSKAYMKPSEIEVKMEVIAIEKNNFTTYVEQKINNQSGRDSYIEGHTKEVNKLAKTVDQMSNIFNSVLVDPNINIDIPSINKRTIRHITNTRDKNTNFSATDHNKTSEQKITKNIQQAKIFKPVVNATNPIFPSDLRELVLNTVYNLNIRIFPRSKNTERFFEKTFILKIERIMVYRKATGESWPEITYTISFIPKFFIPEFLESKEIVFSGEQYIPKIHDFYYIMRRTIELRSSEKLQRIHIIPVLKPDEDYFWRRRYVEVIKRWKYSFLNLNAKGKGKNKKIKSNKKGKYESKKIRKFLNMISNIRGYGEIHNPILCKIFDKIKGFQKHINRISVFKTSLEGYEKVCMNIYDYRNEFYDSGKLYTPLKGLNAIEIEVLAVYNKIYYSLMKLTDSILDCYNEFLRENNVDI